MRNLTIALLVALSAGCQSAPKMPELPDVVRVPVKERAEIPAWATDPLPLPQPADGTVAERAQSENDRGAVIVLANCHRRLLALLSRGQDVDPATCEGGQP